MDIQSKLMFVNVMVYLPQDEKLWYPSNSPFTSYTTVTPHSDSRRSNFSAYVTSHIQYTTFTVLTRHYAPFIYKPPLLFAHNASDFPDYMIIAHAISCFVEKLLNVPDLSCTHLGHTLTANLSDGDDIFRCSRDLISRVANVKNQPPNFEQLIPCA